MFYDPDGHFAIATLIILGFIAAGAAIGGTAAYNIAKNNGAEGWELFGWTMAGIVGGGIIGGIAGYYAAPYLISFASSSWAFSIPGIEMVNGALMLTEGLKITITGAQVLVGVGALSLSGLMLASTNKSNGYWGEKYPNDHKPNHIHFKGDNFESRIDIHGNPLKGDKSLNAQQRKALKKLWKEILELFKKFPPK